MEEMIGAAYNESAMSQASIYHWYNKFKSGRKGAESMGGPGAPAAVLTEQIINMAQPWSSMILI